MRGYAALAKWLHLVAEVVCDFLFLAIWLVMAWGIHEGIAKLLPLHGLPHYMSYLIEGVLSLSTLHRLLKLRFGKEEGVISK